MDLRKLNVGVNCTLVKIANLTSQLCVERNSKSKTIARNNTNTHNGINGINRFSNASKAGNRKVIE